MGRRRRGDRRQRTNRCIRSLAGGRSGKTRDRFRRDAGGRAAHTVILAAYGIALVGALAFPVPTAAQNASLEPSTNASASAAAAGGVAAPRPVRADCSLVTARDAAAILGYDVLPASEHERTGGVCFYASETISQDGGVSYALTDLARLRAIRPYFIALARKCAGIAPSAPNAAACATYAEVARSADLDAYFAARTGTADATAVAALGERAASAAGTLYVRRGATIFEALVRRDGAFDLERSERLVRLLLARVSP